MPAPAVPSNPQPPQQDLDEEEEEEEESGVVAGGRIPNSWVRPDPEKDQFAFLILLGLSFYLPSQEPVSVNPWRRDPSFLNEQSCFLRPQMNRCKKTRHRKLPATSTTLRRIAKRQKERQKMPKEEKEAKTLVAETVDEEGLLKLQPPMDETTAAPQAAPHDMVALPPLACDESSSSVDDRHMRRRPPPPQKVHSTTRARTGVKRTRSAACQPAKTRTTSEIKYKHKKLKCVSGPSLFLAMCGGGGAGGSL